MIFRLFLASLVILFSSPASAAELKGVEVGVAKEVFSQMYPLARCSEPATESERSISDEICRSATTFGGESAELIAYFHGAAVSTVGVTVVGPVDEVFYMDVVAGITDKYGSPSLQDFSSELKQVHWKGRYDAIVAVYAVRSKEVHVTLMGSARRARVRDDV